MRGLPASAEAIEEGLAYPARDCLLPTAYRLLPTPERALWISARGRGGLIPGGDSRSAGWTRPQQGYDVLPEKNRRIRPDVTAEVAAGGHPQVPSHLPQLGMSVALALALARARGRA